MVVDYSQTVNRFPMLDTYSLLKIEELVAQYKIYNIVDLKFLYHQVLYTAFKADGKLYQFCWVLFGVNNGVTCFQRIIDKSIADNSLSYTFAYLDNITICGKSKEEHDENLNLWKWPRSLI